MTFAIFKLDFGLKASATLRDRQVLMDGTDFVIFRKDRIGEQAALEEWQNIMKDPRAAGYDHEGEGNDIELWALASKERLQDRTWFAEAATETVLHLGKKDVQGQGVHNELHSHTQSAVSSSNS